MADRSWQTFGPEHSQGNMTHSQGPTGSARLKNVSSSAGVLANQLPGEAGKC